MNNVQQLLTTKKSKTMALILTTVFGPFGYFYVHTGVAIFFTITILLSGFVAPYLNVLNAPYLMINGMTLADLQYVTHFFEYFALGLWGMCIVTCIFGVNEFNENVDKKIASVRDAEELERRRHNEIVNAIKASK